VTAVLHVVPAGRDDRHPDGGHDDDPRDPQLFRSGIASARAALRQGVARRHGREHQDPGPETDERETDGRHGEGA
jgi:hypothetical protein